MNKEEVHDAFAFIDRKNEKKLPINQQEKCITTLGQSLTEEKLTEAKKIADPKNTGYFDSISLQRTMEQVVKDRMTGANVEVAYRIFDKMDKGYFTDEEMRDVLIRFTDISEDLINEIIKAADHNGRGTITLEDFKGLFL